MDSPSPVPAAIRAEKLALDASLGQGETEAWTRVQLSKLYFSVGRIGPAAGQASAALRAFPQYAQAYAANCDTTPPVVTPAVVAVNPAAQFLAAAPCDANGNPLPGPEKR